MENAEYLSNRELRDWLAEAIEAQDRKLIEEITAEIKRRGGT